jgi:hypothetical protein
MKNLWHVTVVFGLLVPSCLAAQQVSRLPPVDSGITVRLHLQSGRRITGKLLVPFAPDSTRFRFCRYPAPPCTMGGDRYAEQAAADVFRLEIRRGNKAVPGVVLGSTFGLALGMAGNGFAEGVSDSRISVGQKATTLGLSILFCAGLGLLIGGGLDSWGPAR